MLTILRTFTLTSRKNDIRANPTNLSSDIEFLSHVFKLFSIEKERSAVAVVTGKVAKI